MPLQSFINSIVFAPPRNGNTLQRVQLLQCKRHMSFTRKKTGEQIAYYHLAPGGGAVTEERLADVTSNNMVMLFHHGNAEDLGGCYHYAQWLAASFGVSVVLYDYCGYGFSGTPGMEVSPQISEKTVCSDADHMYAHVLKLGYAAHRILLVGRSVGGGPTCYLAEKHHKEVAGVVLVSTFTSCLRVVSSCCLPYFCCCFDLFPNYRRVETIMDCPVLVMHGADDTVVPYHCSCELVKTIENRRTRELRHVLRRREKNAAWQPRGKASQASSTAAKSAANNAATPIATPSPTENFDATTSAVPHSNPLLLSLPPLAGESVTVYDLYARAYAATSEEARRVAEQQLLYSPHDVEIGAFHRWFAGCGHNDIENRELQPFAAALTWFVRFSTAFSTERGATLSSSEASPHRE